MGSARKVAEIICVSDRVGVNVREVVGRRVRVEVVPNAVDTTAVRVTTSEQRGRARETLGLPSEGKVLAWVGRLSPGKLALLAAEVGRQFPGITVMAGEGALEPESRRLVDGRRVRYLGFQPDPSVLNRAADAFLFTSDGSGEGPPTTLLEAAAHGLPIVVNAGSGAGPALGDAGRVATDDARALADAAAATHRPYAPARRWVVSHDLTPWARRHAEVMASVAGSRAA